MIKVYKSKKSPWVGLIFGGTVALLVGLFALDQFGLIEKGPIWVHVFDLLVAAFLIWLWLDTKYVISGEQLKYNSGPLKGKIDIKSVRKLEYPKRLWSGLRPALSTKGVVVHYNKYDEIYFSPENLEDFINQLLQINSEIEVIKH